MCDPASTLCDIGHGVGHAIGGMAFGAAESGFDSIVRSAQTGASGLLIRAMSWWVRTPSVDPDSSAVHTLQGFTTPVILTVLMMSVLVQAGRMILSRRKDPAVNIATGLVRYAVVNVVGLAVLRAALQASDALAQQIVGQTAEQFAQRLGDVMQVGNILSLFLGFVLSLILMLLAAIQWVLGFVRQAGILVLAVMLPLAASGSMNDATKPWLRKVCMWLVSLVTYKPMAAMIYAIGFVMLGTGQDVSTVMTGLMVLVLAVLALPVMMKFFAWAGADTSGAGVGGVLAGAAVAATGAMKLAGGLGGGGAVDAAEQMDRSGPGSNLELTTGQSQITTGQGQITTGQEQITTGQRQITSGQPQTTSATPSANPPDPKPDGWVAGSEGVEAGQAMFVVGGPAGAAAAGAIEALRVVKDTAKNVGEQIGGAGPEGEQ